MNDLRYDGPLSLYAFWAAGPASGAQLMGITGENNLASLLFEMIGLDEEEMATDGRHVEVHAHVHITLDPHRAEQRGEA